MGVCHFFYITSMSILCLKCRVRSTSATMMSPSLPRLTASKTYGISLFICMHIYVHGFASCCLVLWISRFVLYSHLLLLLIGKVTYCVVYRGYYIEYYYAGNTKRSVLRPRLWDNYNFNFDNVPKAMLSLFAVCTFEGWPQYACYKICILTAS